MLGGFDQTNFTNDVYKSNNGIDWDRINNPLQSFTPRAGFSAVVLNDILYVIGGYDGSNYLNDVYSSSDGISWISIINNTNNIFMPRAGMASTVMDNEIYVIGGGVLQTLSTW